jgi:bis(5'-nucleosyl)-tetraphosphatase (symmetrical)
MSTYVVGDIQGCYKPLRQLLKFVKFSPASDSLWCVGDLINRGPQSLDTLHYLQDLGDAVKIVLGNHDLHFIAINEGRAPSRNKDTLEGLLRAPDCQALSDWLRHQPLAHYDSVDTRYGLKNFLMIHAGVAPMWSLQDTLNYAAEVEFALQGPKYRKFLRAMYGDLPARWHNGLHGMERLRVITNYLTRIRFCNAIGTMRLNVKEGLWAAPRGFKPWYYYERITPRASILFGHWAALEGRTDRNDVHALDTGYVWGRELTLMRLEDMQRYYISK